MAKPAKRFKEVRRFNHPALEQEILRWWEAEGIFEKSIVEGAPTFTFYEGPPTANGRPGIHHVMGRTIKDTFCRYKTMKGFRVERKAGWDTHGLPVEIEVEKELGLEGRHQVEEYGIERYNAACRASVLRYKELWDTLTVRMGYWVDLDNPYITFNTSYIETVWWLIKQIHKKGLLYKGHKIQWYSPGSSTVLSSHEVSLGYREVQDPSVYIRFRSKATPNTFFLVWTTTPWTLISNAALAVGPTIDYVKVRHEAPDGGTEYLILARSRLEVLREEYEIVEEYKGSDLVGMTYEPLYSYFVDEVPAGTAWRVVPANYVSTADGTGVVHTAPAFGAEDFETSKRENLPMLNPIGPEGIFSGKARLVAGMWFKDADKIVSRDLRERHLLYRHETCVHNYPHDWRKGTPLMSYPVEGWFIRTTAAKERLMALNSTINWQPEGIGKGRFGQWLENNIDWALSRRRFWGTPLPIWESDAPGSDYIEVIGSVAELREKCGDQLSENVAEIDLHRPYSDHLTWPAPDGGTMRRVPDVIDVWFDSGSMPFAQWHYPFENKEAFERSFPADFIAEGVDQTRGWFYTLHAIATLVMDSVAYKNCVVNGLVLDEKGEKMAKSKGNAVNPFQIIQTHGADLARWYLMSNTPPWEDLKFAEAGMSETLRKFFGTLGNVYAFFSTYANIDGFCFDSARISVSNRSELDRWIISRMNTTVHEVDKAYSDYHPTQAARSVERFVEELSNWYIRRSRRRFWAKTDANLNGEKKQAAYQTVYEALLTVTRLMAPIAPFFSEWIYRSLNEVTGREPASSVHLSSFPNVENSVINKELEHRMSLARTVSSIVLSLRNSEGINVRQPLSRALVVIGSGEEREALERVAPIVLDEVNVKTLDYVESSNEVVKRSVRPNFKALGKRLGKLMKPVNMAVRALSEMEIDQFMTSGTLMLDIDGDPVVLQGGDLEVLSEGIEGWSVGQENSVTVALDTVLTDELRFEGLARETVNRIQNMRKKAKFDVTDRIIVRFYASDRLAKAVDQYADWIRNETLAMEFDMAKHPDGELVETFEIAEEQVVVGIRRIA